MGSEWGSVLPPGEGHAVLLRGNRVTFKLTGASTRGAYSLTEWVMPGIDAGPPLHIHTDTEEAFYVAEGEVTVQMGRQRIQAPAGSFVFVPRGVVHTVMKAATEPARMLVLLSPAGFEKYWEEMAALAGGRRPPDSQAVTALARKYHLELVS
jgi:mannose-6-phosphate isomerase-like protein (cupin superfamily)